jgi:hypothetical protein
VTPLSPEEIAQRVAAIEEGKRVSPRTPMAHAVKLLPGMRPGTLSQWWRDYSAGTKQDPAIQAAMNAVKTGMVPALAWAKTKPDSDGNSFSVLLKPKVDESDLLDRLVMAFEDLAPSIPIPAPERVCADLLSLYPVMDAHIGMHAWGRETGGDDYDLKLAATDMRAALGKVMALTPDAAQAVLLIGGDFFHADDNRAETPANRHKLDVDQRHFKVTDAGVEILVECIDRLLSKHDGLTVRVMRGNHDEHSHLILTHALSQRYREEPRCTVQKEPRDLFMMQWGKCGVFAHHGDKAKPQQIALYLSDVCPFWSAVKHRHFLSGHVHHDHAKDVGPLRWEALRAFCPPDAYAASMGYGGRRALQSMTFHLEDGLVQRNYDPIQRAA